MKKNDVYEILSEYIQYLSTSDILELLSNYFDTDTLEDFTNFVHDEKFTY